MIPMDNFKYQTRQYVAGEVYRLNIEEERSRGSQGHYFAALKEIWKNLPDDMRNRFPDKPGDPGVEQLRHWLLIRTGYCTEVTEIFDTEGDARRHVAAIANYEESRHIVIRITGNIVVIFRALSQSSRSMNKKEFEESKTAVLNEGAALLKVSRKELDDNAGRSA